MRLLILSALSAVCFAQTIPPTINLNRFVSCEGATAAIPMVIVFNPLPQCARLGTTLTAFTNAGGVTWIEAVVTLRGFRQEAESFPVTALATETSMTVTLKYTPIQASAITAFVVNGPPLLVNPPPLMAITGKTVRLALPANRTDNMAVVVGYLTVDAILP